MKKPKIKNLPFFWDFVAILFIGLWAFLDAFRLLGNWWTSFFYLFFYLGFNYFFFRGIYWILEKETWAYDLILIVSFLLVPGEIIRYRDRWDSITLPLLSQIVIEVVPILVFWMLAISRRKQFGNKDSQARIWLVLSLAHLVFIDFISPRLCSCSVTLF